MIDVQTIVWVALKGGIKPLSGYNSSIFAFRQTTDYNKSNVNYNDFINSNLYNNIKSEIQNKHITFVGFKQFHNILLSIINGYIDTVLKDNYNLKWDLESNRDTIYSLNNTITSIRNDLIDLWNKYPANQSINILDDPVFKTYWNTGNRSEYVLSTAALIINIIYNFLKADLGFVLFNEKTALTNDNGLKFTFDQIEGINPNLHNPCLVYNKYGRFRYLIVNSEYNISIKLNKDPTVESYATISLIEHDLQPFDILYFPKNDLTYNTFIVYKKLNSTDYECLHILDFHFKIHTTKSIVGGNNQVCSWLSDIIWFDNAKTATPVPYTSNQNPSSFTLIDYYKFLVEQGYNPYVKFNSVYDFRLMVKDERILPKLLKYKFNKHDISNFDETFDINESMQAWLLEDRTEWTAWNEKYSGSVISESEFNVGSHFDNAGNLNPPAGRVAAGDGYWNYVKATNDSPAHFDSDRRLPVTDSELYKRGALYFLDPNIVQEKCIFNGNYIVNINTSQGSLPQLDTEDNQNQYWHATRHTVRRTDYDNVKDLSREKYDFDFNKIKLELSLKNYLNMTPEPIHLGDRLLFNYQNKEYVLPINNLTLDFNNIDKCVIGFD